MSETVAFRHEATPGPVHPNRAGFGLTYARDVLSQDGFADAYAERRSTDERRYRATSRFGRPHAGGVYWSAHSERTSVSATLGLGLAGVDATRHLAGRNYVSASGSVLSGWQASLLHRAVNTRAAGVLIGPSVRQSAYFLSDSYSPCDINDEFGCGNDPVVQALSVGGRGTVLVRSDALGGEFGRGILGSVYVGYAPAYGEPILTFGASVGSF